MEIINLIYIGNLFRTRRGLEIISQFKQILSKNNNIKLTIYQKKLSKKAFFAKMATFCIRIMAILKIGNNQNIEIKDCDSKGEYISQIRNCDIGLSLGNQGLDSKHNTRFNEYMEHDLPILDSIGRMQSKKYFLRKVNQALEIVINNNYSINNFESPNVFKNILLNLNGESLIEDKGKNTIKINCVFTDTFEILFKDQKIDDNYEVLYDFKLFEGKSSNSSIMNRHKNANKNINYVLHKTKLYENVIYCLKIRHNEKVSLKIFENENYQEPVCRSTLTTKGLEKIYFKVPKTQEYELEVLSWGESGIDFEILNYISLNNLCKDEVYVLNLDNQKGKYAQTDFLLNKNGIKAKRFNAINGNDKKYDSIWENYSRKELTDYEKKLGRKALQSRGALGYLLSMEKIFSNSISDNSEYICIIDDDIMISTKYDIKKMTESLVQLSNFNILKMGSSQWNWDNIKVKKGYYNSNDLSNGSFFNIYHRNTFKKIYEAIKAYNNPFDGPPLQTFNGDKSYVLYPNYSGAYLDDISTISNKKRSEDYKRFKWNKDNYKNVNDPVNLMYEDIKIQDEKKLHFLIGITTFKRYSYLEDCIDSLIKTLDKKYVFTVVISAGYESDINYEFYEKLFLKLKNIENLNIAFYSNKLHYVYYNSNIVLKYAEKSDFDFGFIINDDILFKKDWFLKYYEKSKETELEHLCYCIDNSETRYEEKLKTNGNVLKSNGVLLTFTKNIVEKIGFFEENKFKVRGQAHHDWSRRCCRLGFNNAETFYDILDSNKYIELNNKNYESTILSYDSLDKIMNFVDTYELKKRNNIIKDSKRIYIDTIVIL